MPQEYNLYSQVQSEIDSFDNDLVVIATGENEGTARYLKKNRGGYSFSQKKMLNLIDLYDNSKFETGPIDSQGQRKIFLNIGTFRRKVASKQIRIGVKDYTFIPDDYPSIWRTWFQARQFKVWSREKMQGELINELEQNFPKYGSIVTKRCGDKVDRVPLRTLRNTQTAKTLKESALTGGYVIEEHDYSKYELEQYPDWNTSQITLAPGAKLRCYERYGLVPRYIIDTFEKKESYGQKTDTNPSGRDMTEVLAMAIVTCDKLKDSVTGNIIYLQEIKPDDWPYEEEHWDKQDGRWLGIGEIENQMENQIARNMSSNLRRRSMLWASKKVFQSQDEAVQRNLVKEVQDGQVLHIGANGNITQVDMGNRALADFNADDTMWESNSNQKSFTFEAATGEAMPSGTPFRLGVMLSDAVNTHFGQMKEKFALFLIRSYFNQLIPIFKADTKEHIVNIMGNEENMKHFFDMMHGYYVWEEFKRILLSGQVPDLESIKAEAMKFMQKQLMHSVFIPAKFYDDAKNHMELELTGQAVDTKQEIETMTNVFMTVAKNPQVLQDPNMVRLLEMIVSRTGKTLKDFMGDFKSALPSPSAPPVGPALPPIPNGNQQTPGGAVPAAIG